MRSSDLQAGPLSNAELSELLCLAGEQAGCSDQQRVEGTTGSAQAEG
jgi:hypothetical protein